MKSRTLTCITAICLFAALGTPVRLTAQGHTTHFRHYKLIDVGTFSGPESYVVPFDTLGSPNQINGRGKVVGGSATSIPTTAVSNGFICRGVSGAVLFVNHAFEWRNGVVADLRSLGRPGNCSVATGVNANGEIAGQSEVSTVGPALGIDQLRVVAWKNGQITKLGTFGGAHSLATTINKKGQVVGMALNMIPDPFSFIHFGLAGSSNGTHARAFLSEGTPLQDLGTLGGNDAFANLVNHRGQIAGTSYTNNTPNPTTGFPTVDPFLWDHGTMVDLGSLGGTFAAVNALNDRGEVISLSLLGGDQTFHAFLWTPSEGLQGLPTLGGNFGEATEINEAGEVVGWATILGQADPTQSGTATINSCVVCPGVNVYPQAYPPGATTVQVEPGTREPFSAEVLGTPNQSVTWYVDNIAGGNSTVGTISAAGIYAAPSSGSGTHTIKAVSNANGANFGTATVSISGALPSYSCAWSKGTGSAGESTCTMTHDGVTRTFEVHIPANFSPGNSGLVAALAGTDVDGHTYCYTSGSGNETTGFGMYVDSIPGSSPPIVICPWGLRADLGGGHSGYEWHSYDASCSSFTNVGSPCPDDSDFIRQLILAADKDNNLNLKQTMVEGTWTNGATMALRTAVEIGDLVASVGALETNWRNPAGDPSQNLDVTQGTYPVSIIDMMETSTSAPLSMDGCGAHPTSGTDPITYSADEMITYWTTTDAFTSTDTSHLLCNGYNPKGYGQWSGLLSKKGTGGKLGTEIQMWELKGAINKMYCSEEGPGNGQLCSPIVHFINSTCSSVTPCNGHMTGSTGYTGAMCTGTGGYCDTMNTLLENWRENHVKP